LFPNQRAACRWGISVSRDISKIQAI
jgi:hypothetical protein